ncbi:MarR family transcriptional regulator [Devosia sp. FJ2-5-3]|uniref:MarR family winged helix-turn-helix transcriptional regulator n=1 Tax=Devosia sp. FJ2-5-3 TaxID=2976680 RepID=UPI0023D850C4|nr:MarR family transcriptional regulator [Devosia sp. FJ2-5-3]WEJ59096.1 MarR family transcriptional regulator [Devosia sp. FJ2-5-3]
MSDLIRELSSEITQMHRWLAESAGINSTDLMALYFVRNHDGEITPKSLSEYLGLTSGATTIMLNRLADRGYIERKAHPTDRRGVLLTLGPAANSETFLNLRQHLKAVNAEVISALSEEEATIVRSFLIKYTESTRNELRRLRLGMASEHAEKAAQSGLSSRHGVDSDA